MKVKKNNLTISSDLNATSGADSSFWCCDRPLPGTQRQHGPASKDQQIPHRFGFTALLYLNDNA